MSISEENLRQEFGARLRLLLQAVGGSQKAAAMRIGVAQGYLSEVASGKKLPSAVMIVGLRSSFGVSLDWLLMGIGSMYAESRAQALVAPDLIQLLEDVVAEDQVMNPVRIRGVLEGIRAAGGTKPSHDIVRRRA